MRGDGARNALWRVSLVAGLVASCGGSQVVREAEPVEPVASGSRPAAAGETPPAPATATPAAAEVAPVESDPAAVPEAVSLLKEGRLVEGRDRLARAVAAGNDDAAAYYNLALAEERLGRRDAALEAARKAVERSQGAEKTLRLYSDLMVRAGRAGALRADLDALAERWPDAVAVGNARARALIEDGRPAEALRLASDLLKKDETNLEVMKTTALAYLALQHPGAARLVLNQVLETTRDPEVLDLLGQMAARDGESRKAIAFFQEAVRGDPNLADAHLNLGVLYHEAGDYEAAIAEFQAAVAVDPAYTPAYMNLGNSYRKLGRFDQAEEAYRKALKSDPDCADCWFNLGVAALENRPAGQDEPGHYRKAMEFFAKYKAMRRGPPRRDDPVDKYVDEARRMAEYLEKEAEIRKAAPPPAPPEAGGEAVPAEPEAGSALPEQGE